jgi:hypothetical protein
MDRHRLRGVVQVVFLSGVLSGSILPLTAQTLADNTQINTPDGARGAVSTDQQRDNASDRDLMETIWRALMQDKPLSSYAHSVKVIDEEGQSEAKAVEVVDAGPVTNQMSEPPTPFIRFPVPIDLEVTVVDSAGGRIEGAEVILLSEPSPRYVTTRSAGVGRFVGFIFDPRFFVVCALGFTCSDWVDMRAAGSGSMKQTVTLAWAPVAVAHLAKNKP